MITKNKNKFTVNDDAKRFDLTGLSGKNIKNLSNKEQQDLLIILSQFAGIALPDGTIKIKVN